jgi:nucleotide sugar dehydrogenase
MKIGFIGQGYIGKNYADSFEDRGFEVIRYSNEEPYSHNLNQLQEADCIFVAVPTPTTTDGFDLSIVRHVLKLVPKGKIAIIKSTILPGNTKELQKENPDITLLHSPEFLSEATARRDADNPTRNIVGVPTQSEIHLTAAKKVMEILPVAPYTLICDSDASELIKYANNTLFYTKILHVNVLYDIAEKIGVPWGVVKEAMANEPMIGSAFHLDPVHKTGRGAGGHCLIKDFAALRKFYEETVSDEYTVAMLKAQEERNIALLKKSNKDLDLLKGIYGEEVGSTVIQNPMPVVANVTY